MRTLVLQRKHDRRQILERRLMDAFLAVVLTDRMVLAVHTPEITVTKENISAVV